MDISPELLRDAREELTRADAKAAILVSASGIAITAMLSAFLADDWNPSSLDNRLEWLWWLGSILSVAGLLLLGRAVYPRTQRQAPRTTSAATYYEDVAKLTRVELDSLLANTSHEDYAHDQLLQISKIVSKKYRDLRIGMRCLAVAVLILATTSVANSFLVP